MKHNPNKSRNRLRNWNFSEAIASCSAAWVWFVRLGNKKEWRNVTCSCFPQATLVHFDPVLSRQLHQPEISAPFPPGRAQTKSCSPISKTFLKSESTLFILVATSPESHEWNLLLPMKRYLL